ncbi:MAG TPA: hypothetical protein VN969_29935 [Streptosporangiaceae bacterium]|nr:hypothetical protein [Streptosporangiaceae bacterium]
MVTAAGFAALLASALRAVAETDATGRTSAFVAGVVVQAARASPQTASPTPANDAGTSMRLERRRMAAAFAIGNLPS